MKRALSGGFSYFGGQTHPKGEPPRLGGRASCHAVRRGFHGATGRSRVPIRLGHGQTSGDRSAGRPQQEYRGGSGYTRLIHGSGIVYVA
jgi:hypothetical protein